MLRRRPSLQELFPRWAPILKLVLASAMAAWPSLQVVLQAVALEGLLVVPLEVPLTWVVPLVVPLLVLLTWVVLVVLLEVYLTWVVPPGRAPCWCC